MNFTERWTLKFLEWLRVTAIQREVVEIKQTLANQELQTASGQALLANQQKALEEQIRELRELLATASANNTRDQKSVGSTKIHNAEKTDA